MRSYVGNQIRSPTNIEMFGGRNVVNLSLYNVNWTTDIIWTS